MAVALDLIFCGILAVLAVVLYRGFESVGGHMTEIKTTYDSIRDAFEQIVEDQQAQRGTLADLRTRIDDLKSDLAIASDTRETQAYEREKDLLDRILTLTHPGFIREFRRPPTTPLRRPEDLSPEEVAAAVQRMSLGMDAVKGTANGTANPARRINHPGYESTERLDPADPAARRNLREPRMYGPRRRPEEEGAASPASGPAAPPSGVPAESFDSAISPEAAVASLSSSS